MNIALIELAKKYLNRNKIGLLIGFGTLLRLVGIFTRPIWYDEAFALLFAPTGLSGMIQGTMALDSTGQASDIHPPGYYLFLGEWMDLFGAGVWKARLLSILLGVLTLLAIYTLSKLFVPEKYRWLLVFFAAISPFAVHYSQEIRMYALMCLALVLATFSLFKGTSETGWRWWVLFAVSSAAAQYAHQLSAVYLISLAFIPVLRRDWGTVRKVILGGFLAIIIFSPWLINSCAQFARTNVYWVRKPLLSRFLTLLLAYVAGLPVFNSWFLCGFGAEVSLVVFALVSSVRIWRHGKPEERHGFWLAYLALVPPLLLWLISQVRPIYIERALLTSSIMFTLWIGWLVVHPLTRKIERIIMVGMILSGAVIGMLHHLKNMQFPYAPYQVLGAEMADRLGEGEIIVHSNKMSFLPMYYHFGNSIRQTFVADADGQPSDTLAVPTQEVLGFMESATIESAVDNAECVWFLIFDRYLTEAEEHTGNVHPHLEWLDQHYELVESELWDSLWVMQYVSKE